MYNKEFPIWIYLKIEWYVRWNSRNRILFWSMQFGVLPFRKSFFSEIVRVLSIGLLFPWFMSWRCALKSVSFLKNWSNETFLHGIFKINLNRLSQKCSGQAIPKYVGNNAVTSDILKDRLVYWEKKLETTQMCELCEIQAYYNGFYYSK